MTIKFIKAEQLFNEEGEFVGVKRVITEYWESGSDSWSFKVPDFDPNRSRRLSTLPKGTSGLPRKKTRTRED
jgi:hypothetical protein